MSENGKTIDNRVYRILIVDDEEDVLNALRLTLERAKQFKSEISIANSGEAALKEIGKKGFDLVLSDYKMPGMNGVDLLAKVKEKHPNTIRMLITGYSDINIAKDAINKAQLHNYIEKPWDNDAVRLTVYEALKRKTERESEKFTNVDNVKEALAMLRKLQESISHTTKELAPPPKIIFGFSSPAEFNKFSFEIQKFENICVEDVHVFENKYIIMVSVSPDTYSGWRRMDFDVGKKSTK